MKFKVIRTSFYGADDKPCDEAFLLKGEECEVRDLKGNILNKFIKKTWGIEINTFDELMSLVEKYDEIIVRKSKNIEREYPTIEIYDDYRE